MLLLFIRLIHMVYYRARYSLDIFINHDFPHIYLQNPGAFRRCSFGVQTHSLLNMQQSWSKLQDEHTTRIYVTDFMIESIKVIPVSNFLTLEIFWDIKPQHILIKFENWRGGFVALGEGVIWLKCMPAYDQLKYVANFLFLGLALLQTMKIGFSFAIVMAHKIHKPVISSN